MTTTMLVAAVAVAVVLSVWVTWTAGRLDRLAARVDSTWAALDAQLVRRAAAAAELAAHVRRNGLADEDVARTAERAAVAASLGVGAHGREDAENDLSRAIRVLLGEPGVRHGGKTALLVAAVETAAMRVGFARQFYNDAVRDERRLRGRWLPRLLTLRRRGEPRPDFFEIDDTALSTSAEVRAAPPLGKTGP